MAGASAAGLLGARAAFASVSPGSGEAEVVFGALPSSAIDDLAAALDYDTDRIFRYVADEVWYEPYGGVLRGAAGTLESRAGNSADKALLLAALLDASLVPTRFVVGTIDDTTADALWVSTQVDTPTAQRRAAEILTSAGSDILPTSGASRPPAPTLPPDAQAARDALAGLDADHEALIAAVTTRVAADVEQVRSALATRGISEPVPRHALPPLERDRHVWVQAQQGTEWTDLDATLSGAVAGAAVGTPVELGLASVPDDMRHRVETRVVVERTAGTALEQEVILEHIGWADEMQGQPICLLHDTPEGLKGVGVAIGNALEGTAQYQPVLLVDQTAHVGLTGLKFAAGDKGGILSDLGGAPTDGIATAEWLESTVVSPDGRSNVARRTLFDRIGDTPRAIGAYDVTALPELELIRTEADGPGEYPPLQALHFLAVATGATSAARRTRSCISLTRRRAAAARRVWPRVWVRRLRPAARPTRCITSPATEAAAEWPGPPARRPYLAYESPPSMCIDT